MHKIFILSENNYFLNDFILDACKNNDIKISCTFATRNNFKKLKDKIKNNIYKLEIFERADPKNELFIKKNFIDADVLKKYSDVEILSYKLCDFYNSGGFSFSLLDLRRSYYLALNFSLNLIDYYKPNSIFLTNTPHSFQSIVFTRVCEKKGINVFFKREITIPGNFYFQNSIFAEVFPSYKKKENFISEENFLLLNNYYNMVKNNNQTFIKNLFIKKRNRYLIESKLIKFNFLYLSFFIFFFRQTIISIFFLLAKFIYYYIGHEKYENPIVPLEDFLKKKSQKLQDSSQNLLEYDLLLLKGDLRKFSLLQEYNSLVSIISKSDKYIYFPLHYQPEATTYPFGNYFIDQLNAIKLVSSSLPKNYFLYVKEHPDTFNIGRDGWVIGDYSRDKHFYNEINNLENVKIISMNLSSMDLTKRSSGLATINGAAGLEYVINKKPVIFFGNSWLDSCPGIYRCKNADDCNNAMKKIVSLNYKIQENQILNFLKKWSLNLYNLDNRNKNKKDYISNLFLNCLKYKKYR
jgi:hypothetical protein